MDDELERAEAERRATGFLARLRAAWRASERPRRWITAQAPAKG